MRSHDGGGSNTFSCPYRERLLVILHCSISQVGDDTDIDTLADEAQFLWRRIRRQRFRRGGMCVYNIGDEGVNAKKFFILIRFCPFVHVV